MKKITIIFIAILSLIITCSCSNNVTVSFDSNGGSNIEEVKIKKGEKIEKPINPSNGNYYFVGWYYNNNQFDFNTSINENITLVAKWDISSPQGYESSSKVLKSYESYSRYEILRNRLAKAFYNYDMDLNDIELYLADEENILNNLVTSNELKDFICTYLNLMDIQEELKLYDNLNNYKEINLELDIMLKKVYDMMLSSNLYNTSINNYQENSSYLNLIIPVFFASLNYSNKYNDVKTWLFEMNQNKYLEFYDVEVVNNNVTFINEITLDKFVYSLEELFNFLEIYKKISCSEVINLAIKYKAYYKDYMMYRLYENKYNDLINNDDKIDEFINKKVDIFSDELIKLNNSINIIKGFKEKLNRLMLEFETYGNKDDLVLAINNALDFKDQVIKELEYSLPKFDIFSDAYLIYDFTCFNQSIYQTPLSINTVNNYYNKVISLIDDLISTLKNINRNNYDIEAIAEGIINKNYESDEFVKEITDLKNSISNTINTSDLMNVKLYELYDIFDFYFEKQGTSIRNFSNILYSEILTDDLINRIIEEIDSHPLNLTIDDAIIISEIVSAMTNQNVEVTIEKINEYLVTIDKFSNYVSFDLINLLKDCLREYIYIEYSNITSDNASLFVNYIIDNFTGFKSYLECYAHLTCYYNALTNTIFKDLSYSKRHKEAVFELITYLDSFVNESNEDDLIAFISNASKYLELSDIDQNYLLNLDKNITECLVIMNNSTLTKQQKEFINCLLEIFFIKKLY